MKTITKSVNRVINALKTTGEIFNITITCGDNVITGISVVKFHKSGRISRHGYELVGVGPMFDGEGICKVSGPTLREILEESEIDIS